MYSDSYQRPNDGFGHYQDDVLLAAAQEPSRPTTTTTTTTTTTAAAATGETATAASTVADAVTNWLGTDPAGTAPRQQDQQLQQREEEDDEDQSTTNSSKRAEEVGGHWGSSDAEAGTTAMAAAAVAAAAGGVKRVLLTHNKEGQALSDKKLRRLEKNRLSARECRRRKREATENLQRHINILEGENLRLRLQLQIGEEAEESHLREQTKLTEEIDELLKSAAPEAEIHATLEEYKEKYCDFGKSRRSSIEFHLRNIQRLLMPTQTTSLVMHAIQGGGESWMETGTSSFGSLGLNGSVNDGTPMSAVSPTSVESKSVASALSDSVLPLDPSKHILGPKALFQHLVHYLDVSPQQAALLKDSRIVAQELDSCLEEALGVVQELRQRMAQTGENLETEFDNVRSILTPTQSAKFLLWVANNSACMHMLNELWDRVYHGQAPEAFAMDDLEDSPSND